MKLHQHECPNCGLVWEHPSSCQGNENAHNCPRCRDGSGTGYWYCGPKKATVYWDGEKKITYLKEAA